MGFEVGTARVKKLAEELGLARVLVVNMLDRERADFFRTLGQIQEQFSSRCVAVHIPIGAEHELEGIVDVLHMCAYLNPEGQKEGDPVAIPDALVEQAQEYREKLLDEVVQIDEALMERYLEGEELDPHDVAAALKLGVTRGEIFPVGCSVATKNLGTHALLDLLIEGVPSPAKRGAPFAVDGASTAAFVFKTIADPFAGKINLFRVLKGEITTDTTLLDHREHSKERMGSLLELQGKTTTPVKDYGEGDIGGVAKLKNVQTGDLLTDKEVDVQPPSFGFPEPVMSFAVTPKIKGEEEKVAVGDQAPRRGGSDAPPAPRRPDGRGDPRRHEPDARRGRARAGRSAASGSTSTCTSRACRTSSRSGRSRAPGTATRSRRAVAASSATARSCSSRSRATRATSSSTRSSAA